MKAFDIFKATIKQFFSDNSGTEGFYPLSNTSYSANQLTRTDYIQLYTSWVYVAVSTIANSVGGLNMILKKNDKDDEGINHPHLDLLTFDKLVQIVSSLQLTGSAYLYKNRIGKTIISLDLLRSDRVQLEENEDGSLKSYLYLSGRKQYRFSLDDVIDISLFSPSQSNPYTLKGVSPMQAVAIQAEMDKTANTWNWNFFKNGASAGDVLKSEQVVSQENKERISSKWKSEFQGVNNSHKVAVLDQGFTYQNVGVNQKELDFVESRRFTRDEILAIFKVPKAVIGITDDVNRATAQTAMVIFYRVCIGPLTKQLESAFNKHLFNGIGKLSFVNVIPEDVDQLLLDYNSGAITLNEYRQRRGFPRLKDGDIMKLSSIMMDTTTQFILETKKASLGINIHKSIMKHIKGTDEYLTEREKLGQKIWEAKIKRTDTYEDKYVAEIKRFFMEQKNEVVSQILSQRKGILRKGVIQPKLDLLMNTAKRVIGLTPLYNEVFQMEGNMAYDTIGLQAMFQVGDPKMNKWIRSNIELVAKEVNKVTKEKIFDVIASGNDAGKGSDEIAKDIDVLFEGFGRDRAKTIARTEITRASSEASIEAYEQSGVVQGKEWFVSMDERLCPECMAMNGKILGLRENFVDKGGEHNGKIYDYADVSGPSLHSNCRCVLLPVLI